MAAADRNYPTKAEIARVTKAMVETARSLGIAVGGVEVSRDGTIRTLPPQDAAGGSAFDRWRAGREKG